eukprot:jgi/Tetstr1/447469/TSEL_003726.t1
MSGAARPGAGRPAPVRQGGACLQIHGGRLTASPAGTRRRVSSQRRTPAASTASEASGLMLAELPRSEYGLFEPKDWANCFQSQEAELDCEFVEVEGKLPLDLKGTLFRVCPGSMRIGKQKCDHWLDGDGYVLAFSFPGAGKEARLQTRYVATKERQAELEAGKVLYRNTFGTQPTGRINAGDITLKNPANTNVIYWGGKLLALWEAGCPYELDPRSLDTIGPTSLDGWVALGNCPSSTGSDELDKKLGFGSAHTAHPHVVPAPEGQRLVSWKWQSTVKIPGGTALNAQFREYDADWNILSSRDLSIPNSPMPPHDFATTKCASLGDAPMRMYVIPRDAPDRPHTEIKEEPLYYIHYANAFDDGDEVVLRGSAWGPEDVKKLAASPRNGILGSWDDLMEGNFTAPVTSFWEHRINRVTSAVQRRLLFKQSMDHPIINPSFSGRANRYAYFPSCVVPKPHEKSGPPQAWTRLDIETGESQQVYFGPRYFTEELVFVPREGSDKQESCGYLVGLVYSAERNRSGLVVLDASDFGSGPICTMWLNTHLPHGLHGSFTSEMVSAAST